MSCIDCVTRKAYCQYVLNEARGNYDKEVKQGNEIHAILGEFDSSMEKLNEKVENLNAKNQELHNMVQELEAVITVFKSDQE